MRAAGGECELVERGDRPLVIGELRASVNADSAATVLVYGHFDVQPPAPLDEWESPPFEPTIRGEWLYARGIADDKGQLYLLLKAAALLAAEGALPVNVRVACDGEEEIGGHSIVDWIAEDERGADACVIFDAACPGAASPRSTSRRAGSATSTSASAPAPAISTPGVYGGAALNATHALMQTLSGVLPRDGRLPEPLRAGIVPPTEQELADWALQDAGREDALRPGRAAGGPARGRGVLPPHLGRAVRRRARARGRIAAAPEDGAPGRRRGERLDPARAGPAPRRDRPEVERLLREAAPEGADVEIELWSSAPPG